jgi:hypothetical protein
MPDAQPSPQEAAMTILSKYLDDAAFAELSAISAETEALFRQYDKPNLTVVSAVVTKFFRERGETDEFITDWLAQAERHGESYGLPVDAIPATMMADFGMFRYVEFLKIHGLSDIEIFQVFSGAVEEQYEVKVSGLGVSGLGSPPKAN